LGEVKGAFRSPQRGAKLTTLKKAVITGQDDNNQVQTIKNDNMPAPKGHPMWNNPKNVKLYTPEELWDEAEKFFGWCKENPWIKVDFKGKDAERVEIPVERPYSVAALCNWLNISDETFRNYEKGKGYESYFGVSARIKRIIDTQYFEGGMVGAFNANIVSRKLGLAEKIDQKIDIDDLSKYSTEELVMRARAVKDITDEKT